MSICKNDPVRFILASVLVLLLLSAMPAAMPGLTGTSGLRFVINDSSLMTVPAELQNGCSMVPVQHFSQVTGAAYAQLPSNTVSLTKGNMTLNLTPGSLYLVSTDGSQTMPASPYIKDGLTYVPLRCLCEKLGIAVQWNAETRVISLTSEDSRDGMSAKALLSKASVAAASRTACKVTSRSLSRIFQSDGAILSDLTIDAQEWIRQYPYAVYLDQQTRDNQTGLATRHQFIVTDKHIFSKTGEFSWLASASGVNGLMAHRDEIAAKSPEDPAALSEARPVCLFGDDAIYEGKPCYVIKQYDSPAVFQQNLQAFLPLLGDTAAGEDAQTLIRGMTFQSFRTIYIEKGTYHQAGSVIFEEIAIHAPSQDTPYARFHIESSHHYSDAGFYAPEGVPGL